MEAEPIWPRASSPVVARRAPHRAIARVAQDWVSRVGQLHAYLMLPARFEGELEETEALAPPKDPPPSDRSLRAPLILRGRVDRAGLVLPEERIEDSAIRRQLALDEGHVEPLLDDIVPGAHELALHRAVLGEDDDARGIPVDPMHDRGPAFRIMPPHLFRRDVQEAAGARALRRDHRQSLGLVEGEDALALENELGPARARCSVLRPSFSPRTIAGSVPRASARRREAFTFLVLFSRMTRRARRNCMLALHTTALRMDQV
jgi:hypothetical protein